MLAHEIQSILGCTPYTVGKVAKAYGWPRKRSRKGYYEYQVTEEEVRKYLVAEHDGVAAALLRIDLLVRTWIVTPRKIPVL